MKLKSGKIILSLSIAICLLQFAYSQTGWVQQNSQTTQNITCIYLFDNNYGVAGCDGGFVLRTTNGGLNWNPINLNFNSTVLSVAMFSQSTILAGFDSKIFRSTNSGLNWDTAYGIGSRKFSIMSGSIGYALHSNTVYKTINSGSAWIAMGIVPTTNVMRTICFLNETTGFSGGTWWRVGYQQYNSHICKTTNNGNDWEFNYSGPNGTYSAIYSISFGNNNFGMAVEYQSAAKIIKSTNAGNSWTANSIGTVKLNSVECISSNYAWICGNNGIIKYSSNFGSNWNNQNSTTTVNLNELFFINQLTGWCAGNNGIILKTINGGISGIKQIGIEIPNSFFLRQNYPNPFNPTTRIRFDIAPLPFGEGHGVGSLVRVIIYDLLGREVATLVNEPLKPGTYEVEFDGSSFATGVYFYKLIAGDFIETKKMVLIK